MIFSRFVFSLFPLFNFYTTCYTNSRFSLSQNSSPKNFPTDDCHYRQKDKDDHVCFSAHTRRLLRYNCRFYHREYRFLFLNFGTGYLKLVGNLTVNLIGQTHVVLQTFLLSTYTLKNQVIMGIHILSILLLCCVIFLLTFLKQFLQISAILFRLKVR